MAQETRPVLGCTHAYVETPDFESEQKPGSEAIVQRLGYVLVT